MELRVLKYFITLHRNKFLKALKVLNVSQPALSKQIKDLEDEYQITLLIIETVSLTKKDGYLRNKLLRF